MPYLRFFIVILAATLVSCNTVRTPSRAKFAQDLTSTPTGLHDEDLVFIEWTSVSSQNFSDGYWNFQLEFYLKAELCRSEKECADLEFEKGGRSNGLETSSKICSVPINASIPLSSITKEDQTFTSETSWQKGPAAPTGSFTVSVSAREWRR